MYRRNEQHKQQSMFSSIEDLPEKQQKRLQDSWAETFYTEFFCRIDEDIFAVLYSADTASRPNAPINVLVGLEVLKSGFGWSDEQLEEQLAYNIQVRYALGYRDLSDGVPQLRTVYNFRRRVSDYMQETGLNLIEQVFEQVTDEQLAALALKSDKLRTDSTLVSSNMREMSRLQLLVEVLQRVWRMLSEVDQARYRADFEGYLKGTSGQYTYRIASGEGHTHLEAMGQLMRRLVDELAILYADHEVYGMLVRVLREHFRLANDQIQLKTGSEISASSLQSPDDADATFRRKRGEGHQGYVTNVTETCHPENEVQLIVKVQTESNTTDDAQLLNDAVPNLVERTDVDEMYTDGGYNSPQVDDRFQNEQIEQYQSAIRGNKTADDAIGIADFVFERDENGIPQTVTCPQEHTSQVETTRTQARFRADFDAEACATCPLLNHCPTQPLKRRPHIRRLRFDQQQVNVAHRHANRRKLKQQPNNLRTAVEATVRSLKHPFRHGKLPVRGHPRMSMMMVASAAMVNIRRIWRTASPPQPAQLAAIHRMKDEIIFGMYYVLAFLGLRCART